MDDKNENTVLLKIGDKQEFSIIALSGSCHSIVEASESVIQDFLLLFASSVNIETKRLTLGYLHQNTPQFKENLNNFVQKYKHLTPTINRFNEISKKITENELFVFLPNRNVNDRQSQEARAWLISIKEGTNYEEEIKAFDSLSQDLFKEYLMIQFDKHSIKSIGELNKGKRVCRFCGKKAPQTTFKNKAHAISQALGNKYIVTNEECDLCNHKFGNGIEQDLIRYIQHFGAIYGIKGKNGTPTVRGKNFELKKDVILNIKYSGNTKIFEGNPEKVIIPLEFNGLISQQNIYKALCKYVLSVIDKSQLEFYKETILWINGTKKVSILPKIGILKHPDLYSEHPSITLYQRKTNNTFLPYLVGEFHYTLLTIVFIMPLCIRNKRRFILEKEYEEYWKFFKHLSQPRFRWSFYDFSDTVPRKITFNLVGKNEKKLNEKI